MIKTKLTDSCILIQFYNKELSLVPRILFQCNQDFKRHINNGINSHLLDNHQTQINLVKNIKTRLIQSKTYTNRRNNLCFITICNIFSQETIKTKHPTNTTANMKEASKVCQ